jgi:flagellar hook-associated protein 3 FlgL
MRIPDNLLLRQTRVANDRASNELFRATRVATSGKKIQTPGDGPAIYASVTRRQATIEKLDARESAMARSVGDLEVSESMLAEAGSLMKRVRELAVQFADDSYDATERAIGASEVAEIREQLTSIANTRGSRGYIFSGTAVKTEPFDANGNFMANDNSIDLEVADKTKLRINASGASAFTAINGGRDVFQDLADLETALLSNNHTAIHVKIDDISDSHDQIVQERAESGVTLKRLRSAANVNGALRLQVVSAKATESEADAAEAFSGLVQARGAYEQALTVTRDLLQMLSSLRGR